MEKKENRKFSLKNATYQGEEELSRKRLEQQRKEAKLDEDVANRENVRRKLKDYLINGKTIEEAANLIMQDEEIVAQFSYYTKRGIDLKQCFMNWAKGIKSKIGNIKTDGETR